MSASAISRRDDGRLWLAAVLVSLGLNLLILLALAWATVNSLLDRTRELAANPKPPEERSVVIVPIVSAPPAAEKPPAAAGKEFARTSADQLAPPPENPAFIGERNTRATSDAPAVADAPAVPSQSGIEPRTDEMETTESRYQDGDLAHENAASAAAVEAAEMSREPQREAAEEAPKSGTDEALPAKDDPVTGKDRLVDGPNPFDMPVKSDRIEEEPKPAPEQPREKPDEMAEKEIVQEAVKPSPASRSADPGFRGFQRKTELKGSISRQGRSALDVEDSSLGRYHAAISRAIEKSWQRKVVQNRDFITPGVIRIRVVLDPAGKVRSVGTVDEFGIGAIQKGFTHSAIREAELPRMPAEVKRELDGDPIELLYNFIF